MGPSFDPSFLHDARDGPLKVDISLTGLP